VSDEPVTWPPGLFALAELPGSGRFGEVLAVCIRHGGRHVIHGSERTGWWCQQLPPHRRSRRRSRMRGAETGPVETAGVEPGAWAIRVVGAVLDSLLKRSESEDAP
jgi:hypothetical protein